MISDAQKAANAAGAIATGLLSLIIPVPLTTVQWANKHYYLPKESSYTPGRWETLPFQVGIMNCMGNDLIRTVNLIKSARVGYTKMLLGVEAYFIEHKSRNSLLFQPTDDAPRDKCTLSCAINGIHAAFHYLKKNYISGCVMTVPTG